MSYRIDAGTARIRDRRPSIDPISLAKFPDAEIAASASSDPGCREAVPLPSLPVGAPGGATGGGRRLGEAVWIEAGIESVRDYRAVDVGRSDG
jgi:hypothetical protein